MLYVRLQFFSQETFLTNLILAYVRKDNNIAIATALSGIASTLLTLGTTTHKRFAFPIPIKETSSCNIPNNCQRAKIIKESKIIFIDECSMMHYMLLNCLDRFLRNLMSNEDKIFGGKLVVLMGDFRQILPVVRGGHRPQIITATLKTSSLWTQVTTLSLKENMRVKRIMGENPSIEREAKYTNHAKWLLSIGNGTLKPITSNIIEIPKQMVCEDSKELRNKVYDDFSNNYKNQEYLSNRAILSSINKTVQKANWNMVDKNIPGNLKICKSIDSCVEPEHEAIYDEDYLNLLDPSGMSPHLLPLKVNCVIMLIRNLDIKKGHCNGTRYIVLIIGSRPKNYKKTPNILLF